MREKFYRFMQGRYGTDKLNQFLFYLELILLVLSLFFRKNIVINILFYISIIIYLARALSKNYVARSIENQKFIRVQAKVTHRFQAINKLFFHLRLKQLDRFYQCLEHSRYQDF